MTAVAVIIAALASFSAHDVSRQDALCMAEAVYHEARGEPLVGQIAVANVVGNRMTATGKSACAVVYEPGQFSWTRRAPAVSPTSKEWETASHIAARALSDGIVDQTFGARHFYEYRRVNPKWASGMVRTRTIGVHAFLKPKGETYVRR